MSQASIGSFGSQTQMKYTENALCGDLFFVCYEWFNLISACVYVRIYLELIIMTVVFVVGLNSIVWILKFAQRISALSLPHQIYLCV